MTNLNSIQNLKKLEHLNLALSNIKSLKGINNLENLGILDLAGKSELVKDLLKMKDEQLSRLSIFIARDEEIYRGASEAMTLLQQKGVSFLKPDENDVPLSET